MNRERKFRAWIPDWKKWYDGNWVIDPDTGKPHLVHRSEEDRFVQNEADWFVVTEFASLLDKNGKEIWEGDWVRVWEHHVADVGVVTFHRGSFVAGKYRCPIGEFQNIEVIGNIYENPELLPT